MNKKPANTRVKTVILIIIGIIFIGLAVLVWLNSTGKISIGADTTATTYNKMTMTQTCVNGQQTDVLGVLSGIGTAACKCTYYVWLNETWAYISGCTNILRDQKCTYGPAPSHGKNFKVVCNCTGDKDLGPIRATACTTSGGETGYTCTDTDGGKVWDVQGTATVKQNNQTINTQTDDCIGDVVRDYFCSSSTASTLSLNTHNCASDGKVCKNGACVQSSTPTTSPVPTTTTTTSPTPTPTSTWAPPEGEKLNFTMDAPYCATGTKQINPISWNFGYYTTYYGISTLTTPVEWFVKSSLTSGSYVSLGQKTMTSGEYRFNSEYESLDDVYYYGVTQSSPALYFNEQQAPNKNCGATSPSPTPTATETVVTPDAPTLTAETQSNTEIKLSWTDSLGSDEGYYSIYNASSDTLISSVDSSITELTISGLSCEKEYSYYVTANIGSLESDPSNTAAATTNTCNSGDDISDLKPANINLVDQGNGLATLSWDVVDGATGYDIYNCSGEYIVSTSNTTYNFTGNECGDTLCFYVIAHNGSSESQPSDQASVTISCATDATDNTVSVTSLVSTGASLWFNILIALLLTLGIGYFMFRNQIHND